MGKLWGKTMREMVAANRMALNCLLEGVDEVGRDAD